MKKTLLNCLLFLGMAAFLSLPCRSQEIYPTQSVYGLWRLDVSKLYSLGEFRTAAITFLPKGCVLYLDGAPVLPYTPLSAEQLGRVRIFSASDRPSVGITPMRQGRQTEKRLRIRCINPVY